MRFHLKEILTTFIRSLRIYLQKKKLMTVSFETIQSYLKHFLLRIIVNA